MWRTRRRTVEAMAWLVAAYALVRLLPFALFKVVAGPVEHGSTDDQITDGPTEPVALAVARAVGSGTRRLPMHSTCLMQALAARMMLRRRRVPSVLVVGVRSRDGRPGAHAWLIAGGGAVCGGQEAADFRPIAAFHGTGRADSA